MFDHPYREKLLDFSFTVTWVPGKTHYIADALIRYPVFGPHEMELPIDDIATCFRVNGLMTLDDILASVDKDYATLISFVRATTREICEKHAATNRSSATSSTNRTESCNGSRSSKRGSSSRRSVYIWIKPESSRCSSSRRPRRTISPKPRDVTGGPEKTPTATPRSTETCLLYTSPSPRDRQKSRMPSSA